MSITFLLNRVHMCNCASVWARGRVIDHVFVLYYIVLSMLAEIINNFISIILFHVWLFVESTGTCSPWLFVTFNNWINRRYYPVNDLYLPLTFNTHDLVVVHVVSWGFHQSIPLTLIEVICKNWDNDYQNFLHVLNYNVHSLCYIEGSRHI